MTEKEKMTFLLERVVLKLLAKYSYQNIADILILQGYSAEKSIVKRR